MEKLFYFYLIIEFVIHQFDKTNENIINNSNSIYYEINSFKNKVA